MSTKRVVQAENAAWVGVVGNMFLAVIKGTFGWLAGSRALLADAAHSASDMVGWIAVLVGTRTAPSSDEEYAGRRKNAEYVGAIVISVLLLMLGLEIALSSLKTIYHGVGTPPSWYAAVIVLLTMIGKQLLAQYGKKPGRRLSDRLSVAGAWEGRSDVYSSLAAFIGIAGALAGSYYDIPQFYYLDAAAGLFISLLVLKTGYRLVAEAVNQTMDRLLHRDDIEELIRAVQCVKGVITVDDLKAKEQGHYVVVEAKISVNPKISVMEGSEIAKMVRHYLLKRFIHVSEVIVQVQPYDPGYPYKSSPEADADLYPTLLH
ncbi:cation diffusion facilitator family transporter [Paenibacillus aurantius]|uniref:Cation diffusion facilitator family transporter n=1 Tax=Paenibacillus aurantius TaxID=2918900 RepID=A0AA96LGU0_9BACL|nr:cation diffusion facilitator family transporter [Paenibacillus aurantius]WNQ13005.1 cation diffusion facilitator family transporter [Paenibacillus aurantius]